MYPNYKTMPNFQYQNTPIQNPNDERFVGGLAFPFLLGGVTGAALAPAFWRPSPYRPMPYPQPYYGPYYPPYYPPYYR